jgi:Ca2+-binding RTX toxin-like protein
MRISRRTARALLVVGLLGSQIWLGAAPAHAISDTCIFDEANAVLSSYGGSAGFAYRFVREAGTKKILFEASGGLMYCKDGATKATVVNTDYIQFAGTDSDEGFVIDLSNGPFEPGLNPELVGAPEIEFDVDLFGGTDPVSIVGGPADDSILFKGPGFARLNADGDNDVSITGLDARIASGGAGADRISIDYLHSAGGPGNDVLTGGDADDALLGSAGNDLIEGQGGLDTLDGGLGVDELRGGKDADTMHANDGRSDSVSCGGGVDDASDHDAFDVIHANCEIS